MKKIKVQGMEIGVRERDKDAVSLGLYGEFNDLLAHCLIENKEDKSFVTVINVMDDNDIPQKINLELPRFVIPSWEGVERFASFISQVMNGDWYCWIGDPKDDRAEVFSASGDKVGYLSFGDNVWACSESLCVALGVSSERPPVFDNLISANKHMLSNAKLINAAASTTTETKR